MPQLIQILLFLLDQTQFIVSISTFILILYLHSIHSLYFGAGTLVAAISAKILKLCIKQPRPSGAIHFDTTYGMPSTHSCAIAFFGVYLALSALYLPLHPKFVQLLRELPWLGTSTILSTDDRVRTVLASGSAIGASLVCWSRVRLGHHTTAQVSAGISLGAIVAVVWLACWIGSEESVRLLGMTQAKKTTAAVTRSGLAKLVALGARERAVIWERNARLLVQSGVVVLKERGWSSAVQVIIVGVRTLNHHSDEL